MRRLRVFKGSSKLIPKGKATRVDPEKRDNPHTFTMHGSDLHM
jgi:hypothetical protein